VSVRVPPLDTLGNRSASYIAVPENQESKLLMSLMNPAEL